MRHGPSLMRLEPVAYWAWAGLHLLPVLGVPWFVTLDGPSHLYSARIVRELLLGDPFFQRFFHLAPYPEPYWLAHAVMAPLLGLLPARLVEKLVWGAAVLALAGAFRHWVRTLAPQRPWASFLVMPFLLHYALRLGFLNFTLSLPLLLWAITLAWRQLAGGERNTGRLAVAMLLLYFAHLFTWLVGAAVLAAMLAWAWAAAERAERRALRRAAAHFALALFIPAMLVAGYLATQYAPDASPARLAPAALVQWMLEGRGWNGLGVQGERLACTLAAIPLLAAEAAAVVLGGRRARGRGWRPWDFWWLLPLAAFAAYFLIPDVAGGGSSVSQRTLLLAMLLLAGAVAGGALPVRALGPVVLVVVLADAFHTVLQYRSSVSLAAECGELMAVQGDLEDGSVVLPLNYSGNWMHSNLFNYLGTGPARVVVLDHFTALAPFNPEQWNKPMLPYGPVGSFAASNRPCVRLSGYRDSTGTAIDAVVAWKMAVAEPDSCLRDVKGQLAAGFRAAGRSPHGDAELFRLR